MSESLAEALDRVTREWAAEFEQVLSRKRDRSTAQLHAEARSTAPRAQRRHQLGRLHTAADVQGHLTSDVAVPDWAQGLAARIAAQATVPTYQWARRAHRAAQALSGVPIGRATPASWAVLRRLGVPDLPASAPHAVADAGEACPEPASAGFSAAAAATLGPAALAAALASLAQLQEHYESTPHDPAREHKLRVTRTAAARLKRVGQPLGLIAGAGLSETDEDAVRRHNREAVASAGLKPGSNTFGKVMEALETGSLTQLRMSASGAAGRRDLQRLWGLGPSRAAALAAELTRWERGAGGGVSGFEVPAERLRWVCEVPVGVERLRRALQVPGLAAPRGGPPLLSRSTRVFLDRLEDIELRFPREEIAEWTGIVRSAARREFGGEVMVVCCGSYRRHRPDSGDADFLMTHPGASDPSSLPRIGGWLRSLAATGLVELVDLSSPVPSAGSEDSSGESEAHFAVARLLSCPAYVKDVLLQGVRAGARRALESRGVPVVHPVEAWERAVRQAVPAIVAELAKPAGEPAAAAVASRAAVDCSSPALSRLLPAVKAGDRALTKAVTRLLPLGGAEATASGTSDCPKERSGPGLLGASLLRSQGRAACLGEDGLARILGTICSFLRGPWRRVDFKSYTAPTFPAALLYFTGSAHFNRSMRWFAGRVGLRLSDKRLVPVVRAPRQPGGRWKAVHKGFASNARTERELMAALGLQWLPPEWRDPGLARV